MRPDEVRHGAGKRLRWAFGRALRSPVPSIFVLAGVFDLLSGDFLIHGIVLFAVAGALLWDARSQRVRASAEIAAAPPPGVETTRPGRSLPPAPLVIAGVAFAILVGSFARYTWPASLAVFGVAAAAVAIAWEPPTRRTPPERVSRVGAIAWTTVFVSLALWELTALLLQPSLTTDSYAHPAISVLMDSVLATSFGRSLFLLVWLAVGWALLDR
jgi:hypothetical protein